MKNSIPLMILFYLVTTNVLTAQNKNQNADKNAIKAILIQQQEAWSNNDLEGFMEGYWETDSLTYYSGGKVTRGWQTTLDNYKKGYPSETETGTLNFQIDAITKINANAYYVMGQYFLTREAGDTNGTFMIIFKKIAGVWKIIADSSC
ncbi:MAG: DUF4440 domain-containing protein [Pricia sp.]